MRIRRPSHPTVVAYLALLTALGGSAYAVSKVGTKDLKPGAVISPKIKNHAVRGRDVTPLVVRETQRNVAAGNTAMSTVVAGCHQHEQLVAGGGGWISDGNVTSAIAFTQTDRYEVRGTNPDGSADTLLAQAVCMRR
jgi:hypothetical protein